MNKAEFITAVAERTGSTKHDVTVMADAVFSVIEAELLAGGEVKVAGFGKFAVKNKPARVGKDLRNRFGKAVPRQNGCGFPPRKAPEGRAERLTPPHFPFPARMITAGRGPYLPLSLSFPAAFVHRRTGRKSERRQNDTEKGGTFRAETLPPFLYRHFLYIVLSFH